MHGLARVYLELNRLDDAIAVAKRISEVDPEDVLAHTSLSVIYQKKGMVAEAEAEASKARILGWKEQLRRSTATQAKRAFARTACSCRIPFMMRLRKNCWLL